VKGYQEISSPRGARAKRRYTLMKSLEEGESSFDELILEGGGTSDDKCP
jgi:hypothetical protein